MFDPFPDVPEYFEVCNNSSKVLDLSRVFLPPGKRTTPSIHSVIFRKHDIAALTTPLPKIRIILRIVYEVPDTANIVHL